METIQYISGIITSTMGPWGSPLWYILGACALTIFFARWATAIRRLLPFIGAFTLIGLVLWALVGIGVIKVMI